MIPRRNGGRPRGVSEDSSPFVVESYKKYGHTSGLALDIPCGDGRHSRFLASVGMNVISVDLCERSLQWGTIATRTDNRIEAICADATRELPFKDSSFDVGLVVHFPLLESIPPLVRCIKSGGLVILESYGAHGGNWETLPFVGQVRQMLRSHFTLLRYDETSVRSYPDKATLRVVARKH